MDELIETFNYRDLSLPIYKTDNFYYTIIAGKEIKLCPCDEDYRELVKREIDHQIDFFIELGKDTYIETFLNGSHKDLRLVKDGRTLHIFIVPDGHELTDDEIERISTYSKYLVNRLQEIQ